MITGCIHFPLTMLAIFIFAVLIRINIYHVLLAVLGYAIMSDYLSNVSLLLFRYVAHRNQEDAKPIIAAMEAYRASNQQYPQHLKQLVPEYLPSIPEGFFPTCGIKKSTIMDTFYLEHYRNGRVLLFMPYFGNRDNTPNYDFERKAWILGCSHRSSTTGDCV